jgi:predicted DNA-binding protein (MmcQ/YjbR family)
MDVERLREFLLKLPHVEETMQWGENLVFWAGDKAIGGKMFALAALDGTGKGVLSFAAGPERYNELLENEGVIPAPYLARAYWVCVVSWDALPPRELEALLTRAYELVFAKLPQRTKDVLAMPVAQRRKLIADRKKLLTSQKKRGSK